jgi:hypothetical protein
MLQTNPGNGGKVVNSGRGHNYRAAESHWLLKSGGQLPNSSADLVKVGLTLALIAVIIIAVVQILAV